METEIIDKLYLELSQFCKAKSGHELMLEKKLELLMDAVKPFADLVHSTSGRIPHERLSMADWHALTTAYGAAPQVN